MPTPVRTLVEDYRGRINRFAPVELIELPETRVNATTRPADQDHARQQESQRLRAKLPVSTWRVALDRGGRALSSPQLADHLTRWRDDGQRHVVFLIGGPDGMASSLLSDMDFSLSFGPMTYPHMLMRVLLLEQLYRALTLQQGIPYHR